MGKTVKAEVFRFKKNSFRNTLFLKQQQKTFVRKSLPPAPWLVQLYKLCKEIWLSETEQGRGAI